MSYWYMATPYSKYPGGQHAAWEEACRQTAFLMGCHVRVFCPIAHTHPIAEMGGLDLFDHEFWLGHDEVMMRGAIGMIQCRMQGWQDSYGMEWERQWFERAGKPVIPMEPNVIPKELMGTAA